MGQVMTVLGPVPASELGAVTMHEHLHLDQWKTFGLSDAEVTQMLVRNPVRLLPRI